MSPPLFSNFFSRWPNFAVQEKKDTGKEERVATIRPTQAMDEKTAPKRVCKVCLRSRNLGQGTWQISECAEDECDACYLESKRRAAMPTSLRAMLVAQIEQNDADDSKAKEEEPPLTGEQELNEAMADRQATVEADKTNEAAAESGWGLVGSAARMLDGPPADCEALSRALAMRLVSEALTANLAAIVGEYAPFAGTEDLPFRFARLSDREAQQGPGYAALAVDDWRDLVYVARGGEIRVFDALGHGGARFAAHVEFAAPILGLALSAFPHAFVCVLDSAGLKLVSTDETKLAVQVDLRGKAATCLCTDPISGRLFLGGEYASLRLLPCAEELFCTGGAVEWLWWISLEGRTKRKVLGLAFMPTTMMLYVTLEGGALRELHVSEAAIALSAQNNVGQGARYGLMMCDDTPYDVGQHVGASALCVEARSGHLFACMRDDVIEMRSRKLIDQFSSPSLAAYGPRAIGLNERRRILYVAGARHVQAFEITSSAWRVSPWLVADCAAAYEPLGATHLCTVGLDQRLGTRLVEDAKQGAASAIADVQTRDEIQLSARWARLLRDQQELGPFYAVKLATTETLAEARMCVAGLDACSAAWFDDYAPVASTFGNLHARHMLRAFEMGALWAVTGAAFQALRLGVESLRELAFRALRGAQSRGSVIAGEILALYLIQSRERDDQLEGVSLFLSLTQVCLFCAFAHF